MRGWASSASRPHTAPGGSARTSRLRTSPRHGCDPMPNIAGPGTEYEMAGPHLLAVAVHPQLMRSEAELLIARAAAALDPADSLRRQSTAAFMLLTVGEPLRAAELLELCITGLQAVGYKRGCFTSKLRLVQALQAQGHAQAAVAAAHGAAVEGQTWPELHDLQHFALTTSERRSCRHNDGWRPFQPWRRHLNFDST